MKKNSTEKKTTEKRTAGRKVAGQKADKSILFVTYIMVGLFVGLMLSLIHISGGSAPEAGTAAF